MPSEVAIACLSSAAKARKMAEEATFALEQRCIVADWVGAERELVSLTASMETWGHCLMAAYKAMGGDPA